MYRPSRGPKKFRKKGPITSDDEGEGETSAASTANAVAPAPQAAPKPAAARRAPAKLSFGDEEQPEEAFAVPKASRKLLRGKPSVSSEGASAAPPRKPVPVAVLQRSAAGEYTPEKLAELRKNSKTIYFSSGVRPSVPPPDWPSDEAPPAVVTIDEEALAEAPEEAITDHAASGKQTEDDAEMIPSRAAVLQARQRRERIREMGGFVPLEETSYTKELDSDELDSRLVRDEEEDAEPELFDDEKGGRIAFGDPREQERRKKASLLEQIKKAEEEDSEDEELRRWELEQIKKGVRGRKELRKTTLERMKGRKPEDILNDIAPNQQQRNLSVSEHASGALSSARVQLPTVEDVQKNLRQALQRLETSHLNDEKELREVKSSIATAESNAAGLRNELKAASEDFDYYQRLRDYILDLLDCLKEKSVEIDRYSEECEALAVGRYARLREARDLDAQDRIEEIEQSRGDLKDDHAPPGAAALKAQRKQRRLAKREARRERVGRRKPRVEDEEGWSSEDDTQEEKTDLAAARDAIVSKAAHVFDDVIEEFSSLSAIKQKFQEWRTQHSAGYYKCFAGVSLVDVCAPFVKLQTLAWDPLASDATSSSFEGHEWHRTLASFAPDHKEEGADLVPALVRRVVVPKARAFIAQGWDPRSRRQTRRAQALVADLLVYIPSQADLKAVMLGLQAAVDRVRLPTAYLGLSESASELAMAQFWSAVKLIGNITSWHEQLSNRALRVMTLDKLLNGQIVPFLRQMKFAPTEAGITRFVEVNEKVLDAVPGRWLVPEREEGLVTPEARVYHGWATQQWRTFKREGPKGLPRDLLQRLANIFVRLNDLETPRQVLE